MKKASGSYEYDYFIASRWSNKVTLLALVKALEAKGKRVYCFLTCDPFHSADEDTAQVHDDFAKVEDWRTDPMVRRTFEIDIEGLRASEAVVLVQPAGRSSHLEAGIAYGLGKLCILVGDSPADGNLNPDADNLYLIFDECYVSPEAFVEGIKGSERP